jgi:hypothetical protein
MMVGERMDVLSFGTVLGGATEKNRPWQEAVRNLRDRVSNIAKGVEAPLKLNVVFHIPGNLLKPDYSGMRTGRYSKSEAALMIQIALPEEVPQDAASYVKEATSEAIELAGRWAEKRRVKIDTSILHDILEKINQVE